MTLYEVLGVAADADEQEIRSAFRNLARRYHPDAGEGSSSDQFRRVVEAYETLGDPERRRQYDLSRRRQSNPARPAGFGKQRLGFTERPEPMVSPSGLFRRPSWPVPSPRGWAADDIFEEMLRFLDACFPGRPLRW
jgi:molecular chaperone DnaJ